MARRGGASRLRFRVLPSVLLTAAILLLPAMLYAWGRQADAFTIERITVAGGRRVPESRALKVLRKEFLGRNLFTVTTEDVYASLDDLCYLAAVEVDRDFPTTLRVRLVEHEPALYVLARGRWFVVADSGHVVCELGADGAAPGAGDMPGAANAPPDSGPSGPTPAGASAAPAPAETAPSVPPSSPVASDAPTGAEASAAAAGAGAAGADNAGEAAASAVAAALRAGPPAMRPTLPRMAVGAPPKVGARTRDAGVGAALRVLATLPASLRARVTVVRAGPGGAVDLDLADGPRVEFGDGARLAAKVLALRAVLAAYRRGGVAPALIDVSVPDRPLGQPALRS